MTERQLLAFQAPCARAHETTDPDFRRIEVLRGFLVSTILSVNK